MRHCLLCGGFALLSALRLDDRRRNRDGADTGRHWRIVRVWRRGWGRVRRSLVAAIILGGLVGGPASDGRLVRARTRGGVENRGERLLELILIGRRDEGAARRGRHASERLEARVLVVQTDHMDAQALAFLFQRGSGRADIGIAAIAAVGDQDDVELRIRSLCGLGGIAQGRRDRSSPLWLDGAEHFRLRLGGERSRLGQDLAVSAVRRLAMTEGDKPEREAVAVSADGLAELGADDRDLARAAELLVHAARCIEHDDRRGQLLISGGGCVLGESRGPRSEKSGGQEREPKPRAAFPPHGVCSDSLAARCYTFF